MDSGLKSPSVPNASRPAPDASSILDATRNTQHDPLLNPTEPCSTPLNTEDASETRQNPHSDSGRSLVSKIARLPDPVREQLNRRMRDGQPASIILPWLNALPEVKNILASQFEGRLISEKNLSKWRRLGYERWLQRQEPYKEITMLGEEAGVLSRAGGNQIARGAATFVSARIMKLLKQMENCSLEELRKTAHAITALVRTEQNQVRLEHEKTALHLKNEMVTLHWDKHQRTVIAIMQRGLEDEQARAIQALPISNEAKIEMLGVRVYGNGWKGREVPLTEKVAPVSQPADLEIRDTAVLSRQAGCATNPTSSESPASAIENVGPICPISPISTPSDNSKLNTQNSTFSDHPSLPNASRPAPNAPSILDATRNTQHGPLLPPKMPLTAYQRAILEGKSHEEAEAASKYCGPAKRAQRIREYEQYRKDLAAYEAQVTAQPAVTPVFHNPSQLSGFSPNPPPQPTYHSPLGEIHHHSDRWRVQTS